MMFNLNKEIDEIRLEYYIFKNIDAKNMISFSLNDISDLLKINKSKSQRILNKLIRKNIMSIHIKGNSKEQKTIYKYNFNIESNTVNLSSYNALTEYKSTVGNTVNDMNDRSCFIDIYKKYFETTDFIEKDILSNIGNVNKDLFDFITCQTKNNTTIRKKDRYIVKILKNLNEKEIYTIDKYLKDKSKNKNANYTEEPLSDADFELIERKTRI